MKRNRFLAMLCALALLVMSLGAALPVYAEEGGEPAPEPAPAAEPAPAPEPEPAPAPAPEPEPAPAPAAEPEPAPAPAAEPEPAPAPAAEPEPAPAPAAEPEPAPAAEPEPVPAPVAEPEPAPASEPEQPAESQQPTTEPTEEPTTEPTEEPTPEPTEEPIEVPPVTLSALSPSQTETAPGGTVHVTFSVENAESVQWTARRSDGLDGGSGSAADGAFDWTPGQSGIYTLEVTAVGADTTAVSEKCQVTVRAGKLFAEAKPVVTYARTGADELIYELTVSGGVEPYGVTIEILYQNRQIYLSYELPHDPPRIQWGAVGYGEHTLRLQVVDATGAKAKSEAIILASDDIRDPAPELPKLRRDMTFAERLVAVANSQLGYRESEHNFIVRDDKSVQGWSYYGQWAGMPFEEWCAMFVSYCLEMAGVPRWVMPQEANCNRWKNKLGRRYIDDEDDYIPQPGDLIFFHHDRVSKDPNFPNHVGIVTNYDEEKDLVYTVEGNAGAAVSARIYGRTNSVIVGYASMGYCMRRWDKVYRQRMREQLEDGRALEKLEGADAQNKLTMSDAIH